MSAGRLSRAVRRVVVAVAFLAGAAASAHAQDTSCDPGDVEVRSLDFEGNRAFDDDELADAIVTTPSSWARRWFRVISTRRCLDRVELPRDVLRLALFYRNRGFYEVQVDTVLRPVGSGGVQVTFAIAEGPPTVVDSVAVTGLETVRSGERLSRDLPVRRGRPFDRYRNEATRDTLVRRLRNNGYPNAQVLLNFDVDRVARRASVSYDVVPGAFARFGQVDIVIDPLEEGKEPELSRRTVRRALGIRRGGTYRESALEDAKRSLYQSDAYRHVEVTRLTDTTGARPDSVVDVRVTVAENFMHAARVGAGWGTLDCFRAQGSFVDRDFLDGRGRLELTGRLSKVGIGRPLRAVPRFCELTTELEDDRYSDTLNYYVSATLRQPVRAGLNAIPTITLYSERRSEYKAFLRTTPIGGVASFDFPRRGLRPASTVAYQVEQGRTTAEPALFCAVFNLCTEEDRQQVQESRKLAVLSGSVTRDRTDNPLEPTRGSLARFELRHAISARPFNTEYLGFLGSSGGASQFNRATGDLAWYRRIGSNVLAARLRVGAVFGSRIRLTGSTLGFIPPQERLYAGGPNSVRGFRQNELGPAVYVVSNVDREIARDSAGNVLLDPDGNPYYFYSLKRDAAGQDSVGRVRTVPIGGNSVIVGTVEYRMRSPFLRDLVQLATFVDFGQVWNRGDSLNFSLRDLKITPGAGVRVYTPVGAIRVDVGYNPYARPVGAAYFDTPTAGDQAPLLCVSPDNRFPVRVVPGGGPDGQDQIVGQEVPEGATCPGGFQPDRADGFFRRLTFNFSIGQAF